MNTPFEVGGVYRNRAGSYQVVEMTPPTMLIRYQDGRELRTLIADQERIWENILIETDDPEATDDDIEDIPRRSRTGLTPRPIRQVTKPTYDFNGLVESDFKTSPAGTHWRRQNSLGGLLAGHLSARSGRRFESHAVSRRSEVQVFEPHRFNTKTPLREAKFLVALNESSLLHGFYIEKNDDAMDGTWDWTRFSAALGRDPGLCARIAGVLDEYGLHWWLEVLTPSQPIWTATVVNGPDGQARWRPGDTLDAGTPEVIAWAIFVKRLQDLPGDAWCNLLVCQSIPRERAIALRVGLADTVTRIWHALLPLYIASVQTT